MADTALPLCLDIGDCAFGVADGCGCPSFQEGEPEVVFQQPGNHTPQPPQESLLQVLERRARLLVEPRIQEEQCGFRPGCGTVDQLYTLMRALVRDWEFAQPVHMCFVDLDQAYDGVPQGVLWGALHEYG